MDYELVPRLIELFGRDELPQVKMEVAWVLAQLTSGTAQQTQILI